MVWVCLIFAISRGGGVTYANIGDLTKQDVADVTVCERSLINLQVMVIYFYNLAITVLVLDSALHSFMNSQLEIEKFITYNTYFTL